MARSMRGVEPDGQPLIVVSTRVINAVGLTSHHTRMELTRVETCWAVYVPIESAAWLDTDRIGRHLDAPPCEASPESLYVQRSHEGCARVLYDDRVAISATEHGARGG